MIKGKKSNTYDFLCVCELIYQSNITIDVIPPWNLTNYSRKFKIEQKMKKYYAEEKKKRLLGKK